MRLSIFPVLAFSVILSLLAAAPAQAAEKRALLIGIHLYDHPAIPDLRGPKNDIRIMKQVAARLGTPAAQIQVLASDQGDDAEAVKVDAAPTRANILAAFKRLAQEAKRGDQVLIFYAGHGSYQPDKDGDEQDGTDEIILPSDALGWSTEGQAIGNAITDDEIGRAVDAIRTKGASVWLIFDACHSGTMLRGAGEEDGYVATRQVDPSSLGVPASALRATAKGKAKRRSALDLDDTAGGVVAFYAVSPTQLAVEKPFKRFDRVMTPPMGIMTFTLSQALNESGIASYRDLASRIYGLYGRFGGALRPQFDGRFDAPVFGEGSVRPRRFSVRNVAGVLRVDAGAFDGLVIGTTLKLRDSRLPEDSPRVLARVAELDATDARLEPVGDATAFDALKLDYVRIEAEIERALPALAIAVSMPQETSGVQVGAARAGARSAVEREGAGMTLAGAGDAADVVVRAGADRVWIGSAATPAATFDADSRLQPPHVACASGDCAPAVAAAVRQRARGLRLARMAASGGGGASLGDRMKLDYVVHRPVAAREGSGPCPAYAQPAALEAELASVAASGEAISGLRVGECDQLWVRVTYSGDQALDVTPLYIGVDGAIYYFGPPRPEDARLLPRETRWFRVRIVTTKGGAPLPVGGEDALIVAVEQSPEQPVRSYRWLADPEVATVRSGPAEDPLGLFAVLAPGALRSGPAAGPQVPSVVVRLPLDVTAR